MDLIQAYGSSERSEDSDEGIQKLPQLRRKKVRSTYLITYSKANLELFPSRESFAEAVVDSFKTDKVYVKQWVCCREKHKKNEGVHYHIAVKLNRNERWLPVKDKLVVEYGIVVNFSGKHKNYYTAWKYVTKEDTEYKESEQHPRLTNRPKTGAATAARMLTAELAENEESCEEEQEERKKIKKLSNDEVGGMVISRGIKTRIELLALAKEQRSEGKCDLAHFIMNRSQKKIDELITTAWDMENADKILSRAKMSRMDVLTACLQDDCIADCNGQWLDMARNCLRNNGISEEIFADSVKTLLTKGRGKYRNIMIVGPANCGKTFILSPITKVFNCFVNPASTSFAWVGAEEAEILFLNDLRWSSCIIPWHDFLLMLEGADVHLPAPKSHFAKDILLKKDTPIFSTSNQPIIYIKNGVINERETEMMNVRWKVFTFHHQVREEDQREVKPCSKCFAQLILAHDGHI